QDRALLLERQPSVLNDVHGRGPTFRTGRIVPVGGAIEGVPVAVLKSGKAEPIERRLGESTPLRLVAPSRPLPTLPGRGPDDIGKALSPGIAGARLKGREAELHLKQGVRASGIAHQGLDEGGGPPLEDEAP